MRAKRPPHCPSPEQAWIDLAFCACALEQSAPDQALQMAEMALAHGEPDSCAAAFAICAAPNLLALAMQAGADPEALAPNHLKFPLRREADPELSLLRLAFLARSKECCALLASLGADPLRGQPGEGAGSRCPLAPIPGSAAPYPWECALATLGTRPRPEMATALAISLAQPAMAFAESAEPFETAASAMAAFARLAEIGADFQSAGPFSTLPLGQWIYEGCLAGGVRPSAAMALPLIEAAGAGIFGAPPHLRLARQASLLCAMLGGKPASRLPPSPGAVHMLRLATASAAACPEGAPAALGILLAGSSALPRALASRRKAGFGKSLHADFDLQSALASLRGAAKRGAPEQSSPLAGLAEAIKTSRPPCPSAMAECKAAMAEAIFASAANAALCDEPAWAPEISCPVHTPKLWLGWASAPAGSFSPSARPHGFSMDCARAAAASDPELMAFFASACAAAAPAADSSISEAQLNAALESLRLLASSSSAPSRGASPRL